MKIIYDDKQPAHKRVVMQFDDGTESICGAFWLQVETTSDGKARMKMDFKRWGTAKDRQSRHAAVARAIEKEQS